ncbi:linear amide C-N hydrolase [bacterium]|nr:linear amide C-N hydrolase [bacterium]
MKFKLYFLFIIVALIAACDPSSGINVKPQPVSVSLEIFSGNNQSGNAGELLPAPVVISVIDANHETIANCQITLRIIEGTGVLSDTLISTDSQGNISVEWQIGSNYNSIEALSLSEDYPAQPSYIYASSQNPTGISQIRTLNSLALVDGLYTLSLYGDFTEHWNQRNNLIVSTWGTAGTQGHLSPHNCSLFTAFGTTESSIYGRNTDSPESHILVSRYTPPRGYTSISFSRIFEVGYDYFEDLAALPLNQRRGLFNMAQSMIDGMNEKGVTIAVADITRSAYNPDSSKETIFSLYLMRKVLDNAGNLQEAIDIIKACNPWDGSMNVFHSQFLIADPDSSVHMKCVNGSFVFEHNTVAYQTAGHRHTETFSLLKNYNGNIQWDRGMDILEHVSVDPTSSQYPYPTIYSNIFDMKAAKVYTVLNRNYSQTIEFDLHNEF